MMKKVDVVWWRHMMLLSLALARAQVKFLSDDNFVITNDDDDDDNDHEDSDGDHVTSDAPQPR